MHMNIKHHSKVSVPGSSQSISEPITSIDTVSLTSEPIIASVRPILGTNHIHLHCAGTNHGHQHSWNQMLPLSIYSFNF